ncbi:hypothetical protein [Liquorilactobacillus cacaonum]|nr:hypothetical protein [Liquorilactobacillus cacaonum]
MKISGVVNEEKVFERYYGEYTVKLWYYPEIFDLLENCQDPENFKTISSTLNIKFALARYRKILKDIPCLTSVTSDSKDSNEKREIIKKIDRLEEIISILVVFENKISKNPELHEQVKKIRNDILNIDECYYI